MPLSLHDGTPEQVAEKTFTKQYTRQILCIAENIIEIHTSANPVFGTNIKGPESAVKGTLAEKKMRAVKVFDHMEDFHRAYIFMFRLICRNNCFYCGLRRENRGLERYGLSLKEIMEHAQFAKSLGFRYIALQSGESNVYSNE